MLRQRNLAAILCMSLIPAVGYTGDTDSTAKYRLAINFTEALNRCVASGCQNIEEVIGFFTDDAIYLDDAGASHSGISAIRKRFARTTASAGTSDRIDGIDVSGEMIFLRLERTTPVNSDAEYVINRIAPHAQVIILANSRIERLISVIPPAKKEGRTLLRKPSPKPGS